LDHGHIHGEQMGFYFFPTLVWLVSFYFSFFFISFFRGIP
jgi:hypothetical protein